MSEKIMTLGELRALMSNRLGSYPDETEIFFGEGDISIGIPDNARIGTEQRPYRVQIPFNQDYEVTQDYD